MNQHIMVATLAGIYNATGQGTENRRVRLSVAVNFGKDDNGNVLTDFFYVTCFKNQYDFVAKYLEVGDKILIESRLKPSKYADKTTGELKYETSIICQNLQILSHGKLSTVKYKLSQKTPLTKEEREFYQKHLENSVEKQDDANDVPLPEEEPFTKKTNLPAKTTR